MTPVGHYLLAAIEAEYLSRHEWMEWADRLLLTMDKPPTWVIDLALANSIEEVRAALQVRMRSEEIAEGGLIWIANLKLGFLFKDFDRGNLTQHELLEKAGLLAEGGFTDTGSSQFYHWLNLIEGGSEIEDPVEIFAEYASLAKSAWHHIVDYKGD